MGTQNISGNNNIVIGHVGKLERVVHFEYPLSGYQVGLNFLVLGLLFTYFDFNYLLLLDWCTGNKLYVVLWILWNFFTFNAIRSDRRKTYSDEGKNKLINWVRRHDPGAWIDKVSHSLAVSFDAIFGKKHLSWRCLLRSCLASIFAVIILSLIFYSGHPFYHDLMNNQNRVALNQFLILYIGFALLFNFIPDYISLLETRWIIENLKKHTSVYSKLLLLILDLVCTLVIYLCFFILLDLAISQLSPYAFQGEGYDMQYALKEGLDNFDTKSITIDENFIQTFLLNGSPVLDIKFLFLNEFSPLRVLLWSTFLTSLWVWLYLLSSVLFGAARLLRKLIKDRICYWDLESQPAHTRTRIISYYMGALVVIAHLVVSIWPTSTTAHLAELEPYDLWINQAASDGDQRALLFKGIEAVGSKDYSTAEELLTIPASMGLIDAQLILAALYAEGRIDSKAQQAKLAHYWYDLAAKQGYSIAQFNLGLLYGDGRVGEEDTQYSMASYWYELAARDGYSAAQFNLGLLYADGHIGDVKTQAARAQYWYTLAAKEDYSPAQFNLGLLYAEKRIGEPKTRTSKAAHWYGLAAKDGYSAAQFNLGVLYAEGQIGESNTQATLAQYWYEKAASEDYTPAQFNLGLLYAQGRIGAPKNRASQARYWYKRAADNGSPAAQFNLGLLKAGEQSERSAKPSHASAIDTLPSVPKTEHTSFSQNGQ